MASSPIPGGELVSRSAAYVDSTREDRRRGGTDNSRANVCDGIILGGDHQVVTFTTRPELKGTFGMVSSTHWLAAQSGMAILEEGGNAFDAAVAPDSFYR